MASIPRSSIKLSLSFVLALLGVFLGFSWEAADAEPARAPVAVLAGDELEDEFSLLAEEDKVYTAAKHEQDIFDSPSAITVITREQILASPCNNIPCVLSQFPEMEVRYAKPATPAVGVRSLLTESSDNGLVLVDGRDIIQEEFGMPYWGALPVHLADVERIEVIRGPGSALYGANAQSMVISIITREPKENNAEVFIASGEHGSNSLNARVDHVLGSWALQLTGGWEADDNWEIRDKPERTIYRTGLKILHAGDSSTTSLQLGFQKSDIVNYSILSPLQVLNHFQGNGNLLFQNPWLRARTWFALDSCDLSFDLPMFYQGIKLGTFPPSISNKTATVDTDVQVHRSFFDNNVFLAGVNYRFLGVFMAPNDPNAWHQHRIGVYLQDEQRFWDRLLVTAGIRFDYNTITNTTFSPRLALGWRFAPDQLLRFSVGKSFQKPSFVQSAVHLNGVKGTSAFPELEKFFHDNIGNGSLANQSLTTFEFGYRGQFMDDRLIVEAGGFYNQYRDGLGFVIHIATNNLGLPDLVRSVVRTENNSDIDSPGGSISLVFKPLPALLLSMNYTYRYSIYLPNPKLNPGESPKRHHLEWEPDHLLNANLQYRFQNGLQFSLALHARTASDKLVSADGGLFAAQKWAHNPENLYLNAQVAYRLVWDNHWLETGIRVFNLFNRTFYDTSPNIRFDGVSVGGSPLVRSALIYLHAGW